MAKKKILLRLDPELHEQIRLWAERDFRSLNAHIEFLLRKALNKQNED
ncbi:MAG: toxin-antitoxin system HicB family antitoxin [Euryarchaeota archaeon]|nr:toxin-antitoxin system HicB family antitoxin [Euryarchaeota archaeon]MBT6844952.1 toxin-antitoxin system HicB family antitoxin [Euryarchaeota archaeon]MBT7262484.1 toxin-antitoxin system HicB family antitoxin [Euryarchaeota archaeon]